MNNLKKEQIIAIIAILLLLLLGVNAYLLFDKRNNAEIIEKQENQLNYMDSVKAELDREYNLALEQLEAKKTENEELNQIIENQKEELKAQKMKIERSIRQGGNDRKELDKARSQIAELISQRDAYLAKINELTVEKEGLVQLTNELSSEKQRLETNLNEKTEESKVLSESKAALEEEKSKLEQKVAKGSILNARNVTATAYNLRKSGKESDTEKASKTEKLKFCFSLDKNTVAEPGETKILLRVLTPLGEILYVESQGSGQFANQSEGGQVSRFTTSEEFEYDNKEMNLCVNWLVQSPLQKGEYTVELYHKGYLIETSKFKLK